MMHYPAVVIGWVSTSILDEASYGYSREDVRELSHRKLVWSLSKGELLIVR
jgi:hypothetical protein